MPEGQEDMASEFPKGTFISKQQKIFRFSEKRTIHCLKYLKIQDNGTHHDFSLPMSNV